MKFSLTRQTVKQASILIAVIAISSQGLGVVREAIIANFLGTSAEYDILLISMAIPSMIANILFFSIPSAGIPFLQSKDDSQSRHSSILNSTFLRTNSFLILIISVAVFVTLPLFKGIIARGVDPSHVDKLVSYGRIFCLLIPFRAYEAIFRSILQLKRNFLFPALTLLGFNLVTISLLLSLFPSLGTISFIIAWLAGVFSQMLIVIIPSYFLVRREGSSLDKLEFHSTSYLKYLGVIILVESFGLSVEPFDRYLAGTFLSAGYVSANYYAMILGTVPLRILIYAMGTAIFPSLSEYIARDKYKEAARVYHRALAICVLIILPFSIYLYLFEDTIIRLIFERGKYGSDSAIMTIEVFKYYLAGIIFQATFFIQLKILYAMKDWRFLIISRIVSFLLKIIIGISLIERNWAMAIGGGTFAMFALNFILMDIYLQLKTGIKYSHNDARNFLKTFIGAIFVTLAIIGSEYVFTNYFVLNDVVILILVGIIGLAAVILVESRIGLTGIKLLRDNN